MQVLVTGASGFIGGGLVARLLERGESVRCLVRPSSNLDWLRDPHVELAHGDLGRPEGLEAAVTGVDAVFHLAGVTRARDRQGYFSGNQAATRHLLEALEAHGRAQARFIYLSSQAAAGPCTREPGISEADPPRPVSDYGRSKLAAEKEVLARAAERPVTVIRPPAVYGPRDRDFLQLFRGVKKGLLPLTGLRPLPMSLIHVDDLVEGVILAADSSRAAGQVYFLAQEEPVTWRQVGQAIARALGRRPLVLPVPLPLVWAGAQVSGILSPFMKKTPVLNPDKWHEARQAGWICSSRKAAEELGFSPRIGLEMGVGLTARWYEAHGWL